MTTPAFTALLEEARAAHARVPALAKFCDFPDDLSEADWTPRHIPAADLMLNDPAMIAADTDPLAKAFVKAGHDAFWRLTYENTDIGDDFMNRFACYCLIGGGGPWVSEKYAAYVVYMPPGLWYPWHHHPAEKIYYVLAGEADFLREGEAKETLRTGDISFHATNQPHATETHDKGMMAMVLWRNEFDSPPVLTERDVRTL